MKKQWTIHLHTRFGKYCGMVTQDTKSACVECAHEIMPWVGVKYLARLARKL